MGLMQRVSDILKANINRMLDQAEDPEMVLDQLIQEMQESYRKSKIEVAKALADEKRLKHLMQTNQEMASKWGRKAMLAVEKNDDDLAREALKRKRSYEDIGREFESQWNEQKKVTDILRENLFGLESKIDEARRKKSLLVARQKRALAQKKLQDTLEQATSEQTYLTIGKFEEKITEIEARAEAEIDLIDGEFDGRFRNLDQPAENIEDELAALKTQVEGRQVDDAKLLSVEAAESRPAESKPPEAEAPGARSGEVKPPEAEATESRSGVAKPSEPEADGARSGAAKPLEAEVRESRSGAAKSPELEALEQLDRLAARVGLRSMAASGAAKSAAVQPAAAEPAGSAEVSSGGSAVVSERVEASGEAQAPAESSASGAPAVAVQDAPKIEPKPEEAHPEKESTRDREG